MSVAFSIVAMNAAQYDSSVCNKQIWTWNAATQKLAFATVVDLCKWSTI